MRRRTFVRLAAGAVAAPFVVPEEVVAALAAPVPVACAPRVGDLVEIVGAVWRGPVVTREMLEDSGIDLGEMLHVEFRRLRNDGLA